MWFTVKKVKVKSILIFALTLVLSIAISFFAFSADDSFEDQIKDFPESYKPYLRELHEKYPEWTFVPMHTGLTWEEALNGEENKNTNKQYDKISLVATSASDIFKSHKTYDYTVSTGVYKQWDGGFVAANRLAVSYFMDPRNFLTEDNIFQFELLSFDERHTVEAVEYVLRGSFMSEKKITYYNSDGDKKTLSKTYGEAIHEAGEKYNINPCYLASKILNEVGTSGSSSVSGRHSTYPGIYNFYNIGATDGGDAIGKGLKWASGSGSYSRPWNTPVKSINGGAEFLAETYIKNGQFTGYLQRFNVNPDAYYKLFTHQYMTNLTGALSQGYSTYTSYVKSGLLYNNYVFSIPVYENMPESDTAVAYMTESLNQTGKMSVDGSSVRTGPSTYNAKLLDVNGSAIKLPKGTAVTILEKVETDTSYYGSILSYPYWYKVEFTYNSRTYTGYVTAGYVEITTKTYVPLGEYDIGLIKGNPANELSLMSLNESVIKVVDNDTVEFVSEGTATLVAYDSTGNMSKVVYLSKETPSFSTVSDLKASVGSKKAKITFTKAENNTELILSEYEGNLVKTVNTEDEAYTFKSLKAGGKYTVTARSAGSNKYSSAVSLSFAVTPDKVAGLTYNTNDDGEIVLSWDAVESTGYVLYCYDADTEEYTKMGSVKGKTTYTVPEKYSSEGTYCVKAYITFNGKTTYGSVSDKLITTEKPATPDNLTASDVTESGYALNWNKVKTADGYEVYELVGETETLLRTVTDNKIEISSLEPGTAKAYRIRAYVLSDSKKLYSEYSHTLEILTKPQKLTGLKKVGSFSEKAVLSWNDSAGAGEYAVYIQIGKGEKQLFGTYKDTSITVEGLTQNTDYTFSVEPIAVSGELKESGEAGSVSFTTYLCIPENITFTMKDFTTATLSWDKNSEVDSYEIFRYSESADEFSHYKTLSGNSIELKYLIPEKEYIYKIRALGKKSDGTENRSLISGEIVVKSEIPAYIGEIKASSVTDDSFTLSWDEAEEASYYILYDVSSKPAEKVVSTTKTTYTLKELGESYLRKYAVAAVYEISSKDYESEKGTAYSVSTKPSKVKTLKATATPGGVTLKWSKVKNASYYKVYLYDTSKKKYVEKKKVTATSCELTSLGYVKNCKVRVRPFITTDAGTVYSGLTQVSFTTLPKSISSVKLSSATTTSQTLKWSKSTGATHYLVYRYNSSTESYKKIATTTSVSYTVKNLKSKTKYTYKIKPVVMKDGKTVLSGKATKAYKFSTK